MPSPLSPDGSRPLSTDSASPLLLRQHRRPTTVNKNLQPQHTRPLSAGTTRRGATVQPGDPSHVRATPGSQRIILAEISLSVLLFSPFFFRTGHTPTCAHSHPKPWIPVYLVRCPNPYSNQIACRVPPSCRPCLPLVLLVYAPAHIPICSATH